MMAMIRACSLRLKRSLDNIGFMQDLQQMNPQHSSYPYITTGTVLINTGVVSQQLRIGNTRYDKETDCRLDVESAQIGLLKTNLGIVLDELIDNACKFSDGSRPVQITGRNEGINYRLQISNYGQRFKSENATRIAPYVQFDRNFYEQQGSGLGLAIVKKLLELNQGTLQIEGQSMGATAVTIILQRVLG